MKELIKVIAFDADDTLWSNEPFFQEVEKQYTNLLKPYGTPKEILTPQLIKNVYEVDAELIVDKDRVHISYLI